MIRRRALLRPAPRRLGAALAQPHGQRYYAQGTKQRAVRFAGSDGTILAGTLLLPIWSELEKVPGVVLVAGSGPTDRDGNNTLVPERIDLLKRIAELLAEAGIATLRYDKRGVGASNPRPRGTTGRAGAFFAWDNFVGDVAAAQAELIKHDEIKPYATALLGHSEGGLLVLAAAPTITRNPPHGMVLAATPGRKLGDIVRDQIARGAPNLVGRRPSAPWRPSRPPVTCRPTCRANCRRCSRPMPGRSCSACWRSIPPRRCSDSRLPCLMLQGAADRQVVPMEDVQPLIDALGQARRAGRGGDRSRGQPQSQAGVRAGRSRLRRAHRAGCREQAGRLAGPMLGA